MTGKMPVCNSRVEQEEGCAVSRKSVAGFVILIGLAVGVAQAAVVKLPAIEPRYSGAAVGEWTMDHGAALAQAQAGTNNVIVMFTGAWWCPHCQALENAVLTNAAWQAYVETNRLYLVMLDNPGRADQYWCWLRETNYVQNVAGLTLEQGEAEITNRYTIQTSYATPVAPTNTVKGVSYLRVGYPTLIGLRPDGTRLGRFTPLATTVSLDMVRRNMDQILSADDWDEVDDYYQGATLLEAPACEDEEQDAGTHTLSETDAADWYAFDAVAGTQWSFAFRVAEKGITDTLKAQILEYPTNTVGLAERIMTPSDISVLSFVVPRTARYWLKVSRTLSLKELQGYTLDYWYGTPPATVLFASPAVTVSEKLPSAVLTVAITDAAYDAEVRVSYETLPGTALPGQDYVHTVGELVWGAGFKRPKTIEIPLLPDAVWEGDETFQVALYAVKNCEVGEQLSICTVTLSEKTDRQAGKLGFEGVNALVLCEGSNALINVTRSDGADGEVSARIEHVEGTQRTTVAQLDWAHGESGAKTFAFSFAAEPGFQQDRTSKLKLIPLGGSSLASSTGGTLSLTRRDDWVVQTLAEYLADPANAAFGLKAARGIWFNGFCSDAERTEAWLRCGCVVARDMATLYGTRQGPGLLSFDWRLDGTDGTAQCLLGRSVSSELSTAGAQAGASLAVPAGKQTFSWTVRSGSDALDVAAAIRNLAWYPVPQAAVPLPADKAAVINRALILMWQDVLAGAVLPAGAAVHYEVYLGTRSGALTKWSEQAEARFPRTDNAADQAAFDALFGADRAVTVYWRVDAVATDAQDRRAVNVGQVWSVTVLPDGSPEFVASEGGYDPTPVGGVGLPDMTVGVRTEIGPFAVANADEGTVRASVRNGALPRGMSVETRDGAVWLSGVPARSGAGSADLHVAVTRRVGTRTVAVPGTSVTVRWNVLPLGLAAGQFNGYLLVEDEAGCGCASVSVTAAGRISGRIMQGGLSYSFALASFDGQADGAYQARAVARYGTLTQPVTLTVNADGSGGLVCPDDMPDRYYLLYRNNWSEAGGAALMNAYAGTYTVALPVTAKSSANAPGGTGYLTLSVRANGTVTYAGALSDGKSVSGSSVLLYGPDCCSADDRATLYVLNKPSGYGIGGGLHGLLTFAPGEGGGARSTTVTPAEMAGLAWVNNEPKSVFGYDPTTGALPDGISGFTNTLDATGGYYDPTIDLLARYGEDALAIQSLFAAPVDFAGEQGTSGFSLISVPDPARLPATASGVASLAFPGTVLVRNGRLVDLAASVNPWRMSLKPNRRSGVFKGSCSFYYENAGGTQQRTKTISLKGVLVPVRAAYQDYPDWMGFYVVSDTCRYLDAGGRWRGYPFNWSYDFLLALP